MSDVLTPQQRSYCMSRIKGRDTGPEVRLRKELWRRGLRYRLKSRLLGRPDIVVPRAKVAVFVDGCFWHGCPVHGVAPKNNAAFWAAKIGRNKARDESVSRKLAAAGWMVLRFWEHEILTSPEGVTEAIIEASCATRKRNRKVA
jgi:DNA mismatch endonuclease (patch repair protein)